MLYKYKRTHLHIPRTAEVPLHQFSASDAGLGRNGRFYDPRPVYDLYIINIELELGNSLLRHYL